MGRGSRFTIFSSAIECMCLGFSVYMCRMAFFSFVIELALYDKLILVLVPWLLSMILIYSKLHFPICNGYVKCPYLQKFHELC